MSNVRAALSQFGQQAISSSGTAQSLTPSPTTGEYPSHILITLTSTTVPAAIRWRADGTAPTGTVGNFLAVTTLLANGGFLLFDTFMDGMYDFTGEIKRFQFITATSPNTACDLTIAYFN